VKALVGVARCAVLAVIAALVGPSTARATSPPAGPPARSAAAAAAAARYEAFQARITSELEAIDPQAAGIFKQANEARAREDHATARDLYAQVYEKVPAFVHALRRECQEELALGHRETAITLCRKAVGQQESSENLAALAMALITVAPKQTVPPQEMEEATRLATKASDLAPGDYYVVATLCEVSVKKRDLGLLRGCVDLLEASFPNDGVTSFYQFLLAASEGRRDDAEARLREARDRGIFTDEQYQAILKDMRASRPLGGTIMAWALPVGGVWLGSLLVLLMAGLVLSRLALRAARILPAGAEAGVTGFHASLRRLYRIVLWVCCGYYYVSMPILILLVLAVGGGIVYGFLWIGQIPIKLVAVVVILTLYTLWAIVRSLFVRGSKADPGQRLDLDRYPKLRLVLDEVAGRVGTRPVDNVYMTPGTEVAVMERGRGLLARARGRAERCLILGAGVLEGMRVGPFKAVLAHEYGHFSNRDTAGGGFALAVRRSLLTMGQGIARGGAAAWYNPAWLFVNGFYRVFLRISQGASRLQEVLADRWAALMYGSKAFEEGLRHVIARAVGFNAHATASLNEVLRAKSPLANVYTYRPESPPAEGDLAKAVEAALGKAPSPYDSHPSPAERIALVREMAGTVAGAASGAWATSEDSRDSWSLFPEREALERAMTAVIRRNVQLAHRVAIPADASGAGAAPPRPS